MPRSNTVQPVLAIAVWLVAGLATAALTAGILTAGLVGGDPKTAAIGPAALLLGVAVALVGASLTLRGRGAHPPRDTPARSPGRIAPNTLRGDATVRARNHLRGPVSPVPPLVARRPGESGPGAWTPGAWTPGAWTPASGPSAPPSAGGPALWSTARPAAPWTPPGPAVLPGGTTWALPARDPRRAAGRSTPIPGAHPVRAGSSGHAARDAREAASPAPGLAIPAVAALAAGLLFLYWLGSAEAGLWVAVAGLLLAAGARAPRPGPGQTRGASAVLRLALVAAAPFTLAWLAGALSGRPGTGSGPSSMVFVALVFAGAYAVVGLGTVIGRLGAGARGR